MYAGDPKTLEAELKVAGFQLRRDEKRQILVVKARNRAMIADLEKESEKRWVERVMKALGGLAL